MKIILFFLLISLKLFSQDNLFYPIIENCNPSSPKDSEICFKKEFSHILIKNSQLKEIKAGNASIVFEITTDSNLEILYFQGVTDVEKEIIIKVIKNIKILKPGYLNQKETNLNFKINLNFPLTDNIFGTEIDNIKPSSEISINVNKNTVKSLFFNTREKKINELELINNKFFDILLNNTKQNIPFTHIKYNEFDKALNIIGQNFHTASKPYNYKEVNKYFDFTKKEESFQKKTNSWIKRKIFNENLVEISGKGYWFILNPVFDLQIGKEINNQNYTFLNTRAIQVKGQLGEKLNFTTTVFESQGRFASYINDYAVSIKPGGGNPAIVPGIGTAKEFKKTAFDFPSADALISYNANDFIDLQLGYGRNFLGDGYRSLFLSDGASPYTFAKINTSFWKIKYTNIYGWLKDVRPEVLIDGTFTTKYMASHYLSWNVTKKLNLGFFESVIWSNTNNRGFDASFINPIIFYRSVEFSSSPKTGNALLGLSSKYKFNNQLNIYGQFLIDEFAINDIFSINNSWRNKFAYQIGLKYYNVFNVNQLNFQLEYNLVRPYVYSHSNPITNYGHYNQSLGHNWGSNFQEFIAITRFNYKRWFTELKIIYANRGFDFDTANNDFNYGSNIYKNYNLNRYLDKNVIVGQGNLKNQLFIENQIKYLLNYKTNFNVFLNTTYRNSDSKNTYWFSIGLNSELFNWYLDY